MLDGRPVESYFVPTLSGESGRNLASNRRDTSKAARSSSWSAGTMRGKQALPIGVAAIRAAPPGRRTERFGARPSLVVGDGALHDVEQDEDHDEQQKPGGVREEAQAEGEERGDGEERLHVVLLDRGVSRLRPGVVQGCRMCGHALQLVSSAHLPFHPLPLEERALILWWGSSSGGTW
jgi:hypothetical protein